MIGDKEDKNDFYSPVKKNTNPLNLGKKPLDNKNIYKTPILKSNLNPLSPPKDDRLPNLYNNPNSTSLTKQVSEDPKKRLSVVNNNSSNVFNKIDSMSGPKKVN